MKNPKITIITPSFNQAVFLEETIDSVLSQDYPNLEYLIFDGGSTDNSVEVIKKYERHITYWESQPDDGQSHAINKGLAKATGDVINWLNSDDYYAPKALHTIARAFEEPGTTAVCAKSRIFKSKNTTVKFSKGTDIYAGNLAKTIGWARIDQPETFCSAKCIEAMGPLNGHLHYIMDKEWWIRYLLLFGLGGIKQVDEVVVNFRHHESSKTISQEDHFLLENYGLWQELAKLSGSSSVSSLLGTLSNHTAHSYLMIDHSKLDIPLLKAAVNYALLYFADYFYYQSQKEMSKKCLDLVNPDALEHTDKALYNKLTRRNRVPLWLIKLLRKK